MAYAHYGTGEAYPIDEVREIEYKAGGNGLFMRGCHLCPDEPTVKWGEWSKWRSPATMPREAARLFLRVTEAHAPERVQEITAEDAKREGIEHDAANDEGLCNFCPLEDNVKGVHNYGNEPVFCVDSGACEAAKPALEDDCIDCYAESWNTRYAKRGLGWDVNPWVGATAFERCEGEGV
jgi:hypothetical protein